MRGGAAAKGGENGGRLHKGGLGENGWLGLGKVSGPKHESRPNLPTPQLPTPSQAPNQTNSTALLVNVFPKFQITKTHQPNEKKNKKNNLQLLFFANRVSHSTPLKRIRPRILTLLSERQKERLKNQQHLPTTKSFGYFCRISSSSSHVASRSD
jgi:hypothetical protein